MGSQVRGFVIQRVVGLRVCRFTGLRVGGSAGESHLLGINSIVVFNSSWFPHSARLGRKVEVLDWIRKRQIFDVWIGFVESTKK